MSDNHNLYALVDWEDGTCTDINLKTIQQPRKEISEYNVGDRIHSRCPGFPGMYWGDILLIDESRQKLKQILNEIQKGNYDLVHMTKKRDKVDQPKEKKAKETEGKEEKKAEETGVKKEEKPEKNKVDQPKEKKAKETEGKEEKKAEETGVRKEKRAEETGVKKEEKPEKDKVDQPKEKKVEETGGKEEKKKKLERKRKNFEWLNEYVEFLDTSGSEYVAGSSSEEDEDVFEPEKKKKRVHAVAKTKKKESVKPKKKAHVADELSEEAKKEKAEKAKVKRETDQVRNQTLSQLGKEILGVQPKDDTDIDKKLERMSNEISELKSLMMSIHNKVDILLDCKDCMRKAYKGLSRDKSDRKTPKEDNKTPKEEHTGTSSKMPILGSSSKTSILGSSSKTPIFGSPKMQIITTSSFNTPNAKLHLDFPEEEIVPRGKIVEDPCFEAVFEEKKMPLVAEDDTNSDSQISDHHNDKDMDILTEDLEYIGEARYGIRVRAVDLERCRTTSKTTEKLALNLIEFVLSEEEIMSCTIYGNKQHNLEPIKESKRLALKSEILAQFNGMGKLERETEWQKHVVIMNVK